jgi:hypothetical protein
VSQLRRMSAHVSCSDGISPHPLQRSVGPVGPPAA